MSLQKGQLKPIQQPQDQLKGTSINTIQNVIKNINFFILMTMMNYVVRWQEVA